MSFIDIFFGSIGVTFSVVLISSKGICWGGLGADEAEGTFTVDLVPAFAATFSAVFTIKGVTNPGIASTAFFPATLPTKLPTIPVARDVASPPPAAKFAPIPATDPSTPPSNAPGPLKALPTLAAVSGAIFATCFPTCPKPSGIRPAMAVIAAVLFNCAFSSGSFVIAAFVA